MNTPVIKKQNTTSITVNGVSRTIDCNKLYTDLNYDIATGIYNNFPILKEKLLYIMQKINKLRFVSNAKSLTQGEIKILIENDYIKK